MLSSPEACRSGGAAALVAALSLAAVLLSGCGTAILKHSPGTTYGDIKVSSPRVSTRERLVNDRLQQDSWLRGELERADTREFGLQGAADLRSFYGSSTRISGTVDQGEIDRFRQDHSSSRDAARRRDEQAELDHQLLRLQRQRQMEALAQAPLSTITVPTAPAPTAKPGNDKPPAAPGATTPITPSGPPKGDVGVIEEIAKLKDQLAKLTIDPSGIVVPERVRASPQEVLRDKLEYRGMIRNEIIQNSLDDRHDRKGHTLLRLDMDATVRADHDTSAWAVIDVAIDTKGWLAHCKKSDLFDRWVSETHRDLRRRSLLIVREAGLSVQESQRVSSKPEDTPEKRTQKRLEFFYFMVRGLPDYILLEIQRNWMDGKDGKKRPPIPFRGIPEFFPDDALAFIAQMQPEPGATNYATAFSILVHEARENAKVRMEKAKPNTPDKELLLGDLVLQMHLEVSHALKSLNDKVLDEYLTISVEPTGILSVTWKNEKNDSKNKFCKALNEAIDVFAYGSTPIETVHRIGEVASYRQVNQFLLALNFLFGNRAAGRAYHEFAKVNEGIFQAIRRRPLVVGYSSGTHHENHVGGSRRANFGWILGPRFTLRDDGRASHFRHGTTPAALSGVIAVPGWLDVINIQVTRSWVPEAGGKGEVLKPETITMPVRVKEDFYSITEALAKYSITGPRPQSRQQLVFNEGEPVSIVITGQNLWRSPVVLIGAQKAEDVVILPDMRGLLATFKDLKLPAGMPEDGEVSIVVWTSEGHAEVGRAKVRSARKPPAPVATLARRQVISGEALEATLAPPLTSYASLDVMITAGRAEGQHKATEVAVLDEGKTVRFKPPQIADANSGSKAAVVFNIKARPDQVVPTAYGRAVEGVYYKTAADAKLKIEPASQTLKKPGKFTLTFAPGSVGAFPGLLTAPVQVSLERVSADAPVPVVSTCEGNDGKTCTFVISEMSGLKTEASYRVKVTAAGHILPTATEVIKIAP